MSLKTTKPGESKRLEVLRQYGILDTLPEQALDDLTALAANICQTPTALISLVDEDRQWFKSRFGSESTETSRDVSFCAHAIHQPGLLIVPDASKDNRFAQNPLVTGEPGIRFYAGAPLTSPEAATLGTLCVIDRVPRQLTREQEQALLILARQVITHLELRRQTEKLASNERLLQTIIDSEPDCVKVLERDGSVRMMNPAGLALIEASSFEEINGCPIYSLIAPGQRAEIEAVIERVFDGNSERVEFEMIGLKGAKCWMEMRAAPLRDELGRVISMLSITRDITSVKAAEQKLHMSEKKYRMIFEANPLPTWVYDSENYRFLAVNPSAIELYGYSEDEFLAMKLHDIRPTEDTQRFDQILASLRPDQKTKGEWRHKKKSGEIIQVEVSSDSIVFGERRARLALANDITERKRAEEELRRSEQSLANAQRISKMGNWDLDLSTHKLVWSDQIYEIFGVSKQEFAGTYEAFIALVHPEDRAHMNEANRAARAGGKMDMEHRIVMPNGTVKVVQEIGDLTRDAEGHPIRLSGTVHDITERKRTEQRMRRLIESNAQGVFFWNTTGTISEANDAFLKIVGYDQNDLNDGNLNWRTMTPPEKAELDQFALEKLAASGVINAYEKEFIRKDGTRVPVLLGAATFEYSADEGVCFVVDLTERKKLEQQFLRAQRMESIGTLAGGIAHDLNNILAPILMSIELLRLSATEPEAQNILKTLEVTAKRGADIVRQLLSFARGVEGERLEVQPINLIKDMETIIKDTFPKNISFHSVIAEDSWPILGDATQLHQILLNLCVNARDAMPDGGSLTLTAENCFIDEHYSAMHLDAEPGKYVIISVTDSGVGMPPEVIDKIFEPFFTTKGIGEGTGLGLSTTLAIAKSHGGFVNVYSEPGAGTTFKIYLPAMAAASKGIQETSKIPLLPRGNGETILIVDDEDSILSITSQTLQAFGYRTLTAHNGAEAVVLYAQHQAAISAVLTDMAMPVMDGPATISALMRINPSIKIIAASGLKGSGGISKTIHPSVKHFLTKPYTSSTLLKTLRSILDDG